MEEQRARKKQREVSAVAEDDSAEHDLLSRLPEHLIHRVLSGLPLQEIVKAHAVCKSWRRSFSSFPVLDFRCEDFVRERKGADTPRDVRSRAEGMVRFVDATLTRFKEQHLKIDKFGIDDAGRWFEYNWTDDCLPQIEKWTDIALDNNAKEISIVLPYWSFSSLSDTVPEAPSLNLVALSSSTNLTSLRSLTLAGFKAGEFLSWGRLMTMSTFGLLESLSLTRCRLKEVRISGLPNLKTVSITCNRLVEIEAPSLESFSLRGDVSSERTHPCVVNVNHSPNLKSLTLYSVAENDNWFRCLLSRFQRLRCLTIGFCDSLRRIRVSNPLIEDIKIIECGHLTDISIAAPELRRFRVLTCFLPSIWMKIPPRRNPVATEQVEWPCKTREFLVGFCKSFSSLNFRAHTQDFFLELQKDIKYGWLGVVACNFQQRSLARRRATQERLPRAVDGTDVNGHIWTPHPATVTAVAGLSDDDFLQLFCNKVTECRLCSRESKKHCTSYINKADIKIFTGSNN